MNWNEVGMVFFFHLNDTVPEPALAGILMITFLLVLTSMRLTFVLPTMNFSRLAS